MALEVLGEAINFRSLIRFIMRSLLIIGISVCLNAPCAMAGDADRYETHSKIQSAVTRYIESNLRHHYSKIGIEIQAMDPRLKLPRCQSEMELFFPPGQAEIGPLTVGVRCRQPKPWLIYTRALVSAFGPVVVTKKSLRKGTVIAEQDIGLEEMDLSRIHQPVFHEAGAVLGQETTRSLAAGSVLTAHKLSVPNAVRRGQQVIILAKNKGMQIRMSGKALSDGSPGQRVAVKNLSSGRIVEGNVREAGIVEIQF
ncbi:MAG: flagellar basal body P-ring formation chaperone FlgA [Gammaproteobacteria bacterium]